MKRINLKFLAILVTCIVAVSGGAFYLRRFQISRNAGYLEKLARERQAEGKPAEAMNLYGRYLGLRPGDDAAFAEYARLILDRAAAADATRADLARAYNTLETAVRRNPDDDDLRRRLAEFQIRIGRAVDAREHLNVLRERLAAQPPAPTGDESEAETGTGTRIKPLDASRIQVMLIKSYVGTSDFTTAARLAGELVGFDVDAKQFDPNSPLVGPTDAYVILALVLKDKLSAPAAADDVMKRLVKERSQDPQAWLALGNWHRQLGDIETAARDVAQALELDPGSSDALFAAFELALTRRDFDKAKELATKARETFPLDERSYRGLASVAIQAGELPEAENILLEGVEQLPAKASLLLMLGDVYLQQGKLEEVTRTIARIRELYGTASPAVGLLEARLFVAEKRWKEAKERLEKVRPMVMGIPELVRQVDLHLGLCHQQLDEYDSQLDVNRRLLEQDPLSLGARLGTASALASSGKSAEALAEYELIAAGVPAEQLAAMPQVWFPLLQLRIMAQSKLPAADRNWLPIDSLLEALQQSPTVPAAQLSLLRADVLERKGESAAARQLLEEAAKAGTDASLWIALATHVLRTEGPDQARQVLDRMPKDGGDSAALLVTWAQIAAALPAEEGAAILTDVEKRAAALPTDQAAQALSSLAQQRLAGGDLDAAERLLRAVAKLLPDDIRSRESLLELLASRGDVAKVKAAAADVVAVAGPSDARSRVAEAMVSIMEVRAALQARRQAGEEAPGPNDAERRALDGARNLLIEAENDRPGWSLVQTLFAEVEGLKNNIPAAIERLQKAVAIGPAPPAVVRRLVALLYATNRLDEAQQAMQSLGAEGQQGTERISAEIELRAGRLEEAVALAERSVAGDSKDAGDLLWLGQLLDRSGKTERAGTVFAEAVEIAPQRADVWLAMFSHSIAVGKRAAAEQALDKAAALLPEPQRQLAQGQGMEMLGRIDEAERLFEEAVAVAPENLDARRGLADFYVRCGRLNRARDVLHELIDSPQSTTAANQAKILARRLLAELIASRGNFRELQQAVEMLRANAASDGVLQPEDLGLTVSLLAGRPEPASWRQAIELLEKLNRSRSLNMAQRITLARLLERVGRWTDCRDEFVSIVAAPNTPPPYVAELVEKLIDHGELSSAKTWLARLQKTTAGTAITTALEAKMAFAQNDRKLAADTARKLMPGGIVPGNQPEQLAALAKLMEELAFPKAADKVLAQYAESAPDGVLARAEFLGRQKRADEALDLLEKSWDSLPLEKLLSSAVEVIRSQDDPTAGIARVEPWLAKARRLDPGSVVAPVLEAELHTLQGRDDEAERLYRDLLTRQDLAPVQNAIVSNNLACQLAKPATAEEAHRLIDDAIAKVGPLPDLLDTRGLVRMALGRKSEALTDLQEAALQPSDVKYMHLAWAQLETGDKAAAQKSLESARKRGLTVLRLAPDDRARLAQLESALGTAAASPQG
jgi:tetratricopeptide (TPR) repeat protein